MVLFLYLYSLVIRFLILAPH